MNGWMTTRTAAEYADCSINVIRDVAQNGDLSGSKTNGVWRFRPADIDAWLERNRVEVSGRRGNRRLRAV